MREHKWKVVYLRSKEVSHIHRFKEEKLATKKYDHRR
jgi:hypothetical protein